MSLDSPENNALGKGGQIIQLLSLIIATRDIYCTPYNSYGIMLFCNCIRICTHYLSFIIWTLLGRRILK